jgi:hypothetical protein
MNFADIRLLQSVTQSPCVTITLPTHRTSPDNLQDRIRLKNLVVQASERLIKDYGQREIAHVLTHLNQLVEQIDDQANLDGLVLCVNHDMAQCFVVPFTVQERVVIDDTFYMRDLVYGLNRTINYWVVTLNENATRLFRGTNDVLVEQTAFGFPMTHTGPGGTTNLPDGIGIDRSNVRDEGHRTFFRAVDAGVHAAHRQEALPVVVVGVDRFVTFYHEVSDHASDIMATVRGSHDTSTAHQLAQVVWPTVQTHASQLITQALNELQVAVGGNRYVASVADVWRVAHEGRGQHLLVERAFVYPAHVDTSGMQVTAAIDATAPDVLDDAVDEIITQVMATGGQVTFVSPGDLQAYQHIALITRY